MRLIISKAKSLDTFSKNIILVFTGTTVLNVFNFLCQLLVAHKFSKADFASFNALLAIFTMISTPLATMQTAVAKYTSEFNAHNQSSRIKDLLSALLGKLLVAAIIIILFFSFISPVIMNSLKISSAYSGYTLALLIASSCIAPLFLGSMQGLEIFKWLMAVLVITGLMRLVVLFIFITIGFRIAGALGSLLIANLLSIVMLMSPLSPFLSFKHPREKIDYRGFFSYLFPVAISSFCYMGLVSTDMILVKYFFMPEEAGLYSLAQMAGKIFLFLPGAISFTMFPRISNLNAQGKDTVPILKRALLYTVILCLSAALIYNLFPGFILKIMTGKDFPESILLGRLFSVSMSFFALALILNQYFLSLKDMRFIKYIILSVCMQSLAMILFHKSLVQIQIILCINAGLFFLINLMLIYRQKAV
jgi:O-antigen/teichoic acid export membrane protein